MARNIEIKAKIRNPSALRATVSILAGPPVAIIQQTDTFFQVPRGRLKLREMPGVRAQLISYDRQDTREPKLSNYFICETGDPDGLKAIFSAAFGIRGCVCKERHLHLIGQTRIHLDWVQGLGHFLELEVVLRPDQQAMEGQTIARDLMARLDIQESDLMEKGYIDLLECGAGNDPPSGS